MKILRLLDSEGRQVTFHADDQGDLYIHDDRLPLGEAPALRFCGPGGDACYALRTKRAIRDLMNAIHLDLAEGKARGEIREWDADFPKPVPLDRLLAEYGFDPPYVGEEP